MINSFKTLTFFFLVAITRRIKGSPSTCNLTCDMIQCTVCSPEGPELECNSLEREREHEWALWQKGIFFGQKWSKSERIHDLLDTVQLVSGYGNQVCYIYKSSTLMNFSNGINTKKNLSSLYRIYYGSIG